MEQSFYPLYNVCAIAGGSLLLAAILTALTKWPRRTKEEKDDA